MKKSVLKDLTFLFLCWGFSALGIWLVLKILLERLEYFLLLMW